MACVAVRGTGEVMHDVVVVPPSTAVVYERAIRRRDERNFEVLQRITAGDELRARSAVPARRSGVRGTAADPHERGQRREMLRRGRALTDAKPSGPWLLMLSCRPKSSAHRAAASARARWKIRAVRPRDRAWRTSALASARCRQQCAAVDGPALQHAAAQVLGQGSGSSGWPRGTVCHQMTKKAS